MVDKFIKEEGVKEISIGTIVITLLLYVNDVVVYANNRVLCANTLGDAQKIMKALENFRMHTKLSVKINQRLCL